MKITKHTIIKTLMVLFLATYLSLLYFADYAADVSMEQITASMEKNQSVSSLPKQSRTDLRRFYQIDDSDTKGYAFYKAASPMAVEEVLIVKARNKKQADSFLENAQAHLKSQKQIFEGYGTNQMALLNEAIVESRGNYVFYFCGQDAPALHKAFLSLI